MLNMISILNGLPWIILQYIGITAEDLSRNSIQFVTMFDKWTLIFLQDVHTFTVSY